MALDLSDELRGLLALHLLPGLGPLRTAALLEHFGSADAILRASAPPWPGYTASARSCRPHWSKPAARSTSTASWR